MSVQSLAQESVWGKQESLMKNAYKSVHFSSMMQDILQTSSGSCLTHSHVWIQAKQVTVHRCAPLQRKLMPFQISIVPNYLCQLICVSKSFLQKGTWMQQGWVSLCHSTELPRPLVALAEFWSALNTRL